MTLKNEISLCIPENRRPEKQRENASRMDAVKRHREAQAEEKSLNELYEMRDQMYHAQQEAHHGACRSLRSETFRYMQSTWKNALSVRGMTYGSLMSM